MKTMNTTISTIIIMTQNLEELLGFYREGLALGTASYEEENHVGFELGENYFGFDKVEKTEGQPPGSVTLWFEVDDLEAVFEKMKSLNASVKFPPTDKPWGGRIAAVIDPDGNVVGLSQRNT